MYSTYGIIYNHVCGRVIGYAYNSPDAFHGPQTIEDSYVDGVSLTHGLPGARQHVWTFVAGVFESLASNPDTCPCVGGRDPPPSWEMTTSAKVGILAQALVIYSMPATHFGMVRVVDPLPAAN